MALSVYDISTLASPCIDLLHLLNTNFSFLENLAYLQHTSVDIENMDTKGSSFVNTQSIKNTIWFDNLIRRNLVWQFYEQKQSWFTLEKCWNAPTMGVSHNRTQFSQNSNDQTRTSGVHSLIGRSNCDLTEQWGSPFHGHAMPILDTWYRQLNTLLKI